MFRRSKRPYRLKIFGERNTGTRALAQMIRHNTDARLQFFSAPKNERAAEFEALWTQVENIPRAAWRKMYRDALLDMEVAQADATRAWKHTKPVWTSEFAKQNISPVFMVRNPYSWFLALARRPYHRRGIYARSLEEFADSPWMTVGRDNMDRILPSPLTLWNDKLRAYGMFEGRAKSAKLPTSVIKFEDFVIDPVAVVRALMVKLDIPFDDIQPIQKSTKDDSRNQPEIANYYAAEQWKEYLSQGLVETLNNLIDWDTAATHGYERLDPADFPQMLSASKAIKLSSEIGWLSNSNLD